MAANTRWLELAMLTARMAETIPLRRMAVHAVGTLIIALMAAVTIAVLLAFALFLGYRLLRAEGVGEAEALAIIGGADLLLILGFGVWVWHRLRQIRHVAKKASFPDPATITATVEAFMRGLLEPASKNPSSH